MTIDDKEYRFLFDSLQRKYKLIKETSLDKDFFLSLADFYKFIVKNSKLEFVVEMFGSEYDKDHEEINKLASAILKESEEAYKKILFSIKEKNIVNVDDLKLIEDYCLDRIVSFTPDQ